MTYAIGRYCYKRALLTNIDICLYYYLIVIQLNVPYDVTLSAVVKRRGERKIKVKTSRGVVEGRVVGSVVCVVSSFMLAGGERRSREAHVRAPQRGVADGGGEGRRTRCRTLLPDDGVRPSVVWPRGARPPHAVLYVSLTASAPCRRRSESFAARTHTVVVVVRVVYSPPIRVNFIIPISFISPMYVCLYRPNDDKYYREATYSIQYSGAM